MVTDPSHPLFGRVFQLVGLARLPGHVRHCQVEIFPGRFGYVPVASTNLGGNPPELRAVLSQTAIEQFVATFQAVALERRCNDVTKHSSAHLGTSVGNRPDSRRQRNHSDSHGGD